MKKLFLIVPLVTLMPLAMIACSNVKKNLGMERAQPDEFAVTDGAPLTMPPNFNLMPPQPGAPRPQETKTSSTAQNLVLGTGTGSTTTAAPQETAAPDISVAASSLNKNADADLLSDASDAAAKPVDKSTTKDAVLKPTDESKRLQQQHINTTTSPVMKSSK